MNLQLNHIVPYALKDRISPTSDIWNKSVCFESGKEYQIKAVSGSGKSTFISSIYGIRRDYTGTVFYNDKNITELDSDGLSADRKSKISVVFQDLRLFLHLSAGENILLNSAAKTLNPEQADWADQLGVTPFLHQPCAVLSYGERQRIAILRALSQPFEVLLLDEPFSHLDQGNAQTAYHIIKNQATQLKASILMTTLGNEAFLAPDIQLML